MIKLIFYFDKSLSDIEYGLHQLQFELANFGTGCIAQFFLFWGEVRNGKPLARCDACNGKVVCHLIYPCFLVGPMATFSVF